MAQTPYQNLQQRGPQPAQYLGPQTPWQNLQQTGPQPAQNLGPQGTGTSPYNTINPPFQNQNAPWQNALMGYMGRDQRMGPGNNIFYKPGQGPGPGAGFTHPFANAGVGGTPWHDPAMRKQIQAYEQLVAKDRAGGLTAAERKQLVAARSKLQDAARAQQKAETPSWLGQLTREMQTGRAAPGDAFQSVLRDMMGKMFQQQGQAGGAGG